MSPIIVNKQDINHIYTILAQAQQKVLWKILQKSFITKKYTQSKTSHTLKIDVFELLDNKNIGKLFSKYERFFLDQADSSSNTSQILIL